MESPEYQGYRKDLAKKLKSQPNKSFRRDILSFEKVFSRYPVNRINKIRETFFSRQATKIEKIVQGSQNFDELIDKLIEGRVFLINNVRGINRTEHVVKKVKIARYFNDPNLAPEEGGLRAKVKELLIKEDEALRQHPITPAKYAEYLSILYPDINVSPEDAERLFQKLPPEVFGSIDIGMERLCILLNSMEGTQTSFSCCGHDTEVDYNDLPVYYKHAYIGVKTNTPELAQSLLSLQMKNKDQKIEVAEKGPGHLVISFYQLPTAQWIKLNNKRTPQELDEESRRGLSELLRENVDLNDKNLEAKLRAYLEMKGVNSRPWPSNSNFPNELLDLFPSVKRIKEYQDYNKSEEAYQRVTAFIKTIEEIVENIRNRD